MRKYLYILTLCVLAFSSCKKDDEVGGTAVQNLSGEWYVQVTQIDPASGAVIDATDLTYYKISTYNTSDNSPVLMWMDDPNPDYGGFKAKVNVDLGNKAFSATAADDIYNDAKITVRNGKVITNGAVGPVSKAVTDAISYDVVYPGDPTIYRFKGYARTRFPGDDH